jgi:hypothetical protein
MKNRLFTLSAVALLLSLWSLPAKATLVGTPVTGSLTFSELLSNYFDPGYGFVPATGYLNISSTTVAISGSAVEFGFDDGLSRISADFSATEVTISDLIELSGGTSGFRLTFTDSAFTGKYLIAGSDSLPLSDDSLVGDVITLDYPGGNPTQGQTLTAVFTIASVPEPSVLGLMFVSALLALAFLITLSGGRGSENTGWYITLYPYVLTSQQLYRTYFRRLLGRCPSRHSAST